MSAHTPGPWTLSDDAVRRVIKSAGTKPRTVCIIESWTTEPDATLLAAAPDLLAALREALRVLEDDSDATPRATAREMARAALKQAGAL